MIDASRGLGLFSLTDQVVVVTGATGGIGVEVSRGLSAAGARVGLNGRRAAPVEDLAAEISGSFALPFDITDEAASATALGSVVERYGRLDALVCIAAARDRRPLAEIETDDYRTVLEANLVAPFQLARTVAPYMISAGRGRIIMMTSLAGDFAMPGDAAYLQIYIDHKPYRVHRLIWKMYHGRDPVSHVDHRDGNRTNNAIRNLRDVTPLQNARNRCKVSTNSSGRLGVSKCSTTGLWVADIGLNDRSVHLGKYERLECAVSARECGERYLFGVVSQDREAT